MDKKKIAELMGRFEAKRLKTGNLRTPPFRMSYPNLFQPSKSDDDEFKSKYGVTMLFPKGTNLKLLEQAVKDAAVAKFGQKINMAAIRLPFRDQGTKDKEGYESGAMFARANSDSRPGIVGPDRKPLTDENLARAGFWAVATINPYAYDKKGKGVAFGLQNIAIIAADETFGRAAVDPDDEFNDVLDGSADASEMFGEDEHEDETEDASDFL